MSVLDILDGLEKALPILGTMVGHPEMGVLAQRLLDIAETEIDRRAHSSGKTRSEVLADAAIAYPEARAANDKLSALGHEQS